MKKLLKQLRNKILKGFGLTCKDFEINCAVCQVWMAYQILEDAFED